MSASRVKGASSPELLPPPAGYRGAALFAEPLAKHTSYGVGGPADAFYEPADTADLVILLRALHDAGIDVIVIGAGTNLLVSDAGVRGAVVRIGEGFSEIRIDGTEVVSGAGARLKALAEACADAGLTGLEFACGIPGSVGGAVAMNAGAWGGRIEDVLRSVVLASCDGRIEDVEPADLKMAYRSSALRGSDRFVVEATFSLELGDTEEIRDRMAEFDQKRAARQPPGRTAGCVFKNPPGDRAGRLLDQAGARGLSEGGAQVSDVHANFVVNTGSAAASDIRRLVQKMQSCVEKKSGVRLEPEIEFIGEW